MALPRLLILSFTDARRDPRVFRQASHLREHYAITLAGFGDPELDGVAFLPIRRRPKTLLSQGRIALNLLLGNAGPAARRFAFVDPITAEVKTFDLVLVNDAEPLPLGFALAKGAPVIFDAHEYYPKEFERSFTWRLLFQPYMTKVCATYIPRCAGMTTVCRGIADAYRSAFGVVPELVFNAPAAENLPVNPVVEDCIRLIHHGAANPDRHIECMLEAMDHLDSRFTLDLYLVGQGNYADALRSKAETRRNVAWRDPVPMQDLSMVSNAYDLGIFLAPPSTFNLAHCLPNKFFEFIQARLAIAIGPSPEMAAIVKKHELGVIADDFTPQALAAKLNALTVGEIMRYKQNADAAAHIFTAEAGMQTLMGVLQRALAERKGLPLLGAGGIF